MKHNNYYICIFLISLCHNYSNVITFNEDVTCNGNIIIEGDMIANGPIIINGDLCKIIDTINISSRTNAIITFNEGSLIQITNPLTYEGNNPTYLVLDKNNNQLYSTNNINTDLVTIASLTVDNIESPAGSNLNIGSPTDIITIGNSNNQCLFNDVLDINSPMISENNQPVSIKGNISFVNSLQADAISCNNGSVLFGSNTDTLPIIFTTKTFSMNEPIQSLNDINIGSNDGSSSIKINGQIITENIIFGSPENNVISINGLPIITNQKDIQSYIAIKDNEVYQIKNTFQNTTVTDYSINEPLAITYISSYSNIVFTNLTNSYANSTFTIFTNDINITTRNQKPLFDHLTSTSKVIVNKPAPSATSFKSITCNISCISMTIYQLLSYTDNTPIDTIVFTFPIYTFTGIITTPLKNSLWRLGLTSDNCLVGKTLKNYINVKLQSKILENNAYLNIIPKKYIYKDSYQMYNNDICPKTKKKIIHYGFITEELATLNIPELITYDKNNEAYNYDSIILWDILNSVIDLFKIKLNIINDKLFILDQYTIKLEKYISKINQTIKKKQKCIKEIKNHMQKRKDFI
jgi:hypothetical protein